LDDIRVDLVIIRVLARLPPCCHCFALLFSTEWQN
jgi:hypothetical protein